MSDVLKNAIDRKALQMRAQGKKPFSPLRSLERQRRIGIKPQDRRDKKTFL